jgi:transglutaminase-like putative cysteine protease
LLKALAVLAMLVTPIAGVWLASSLAALTNGRPWLALFAGLLLFPILPALWELWSVWQRSRKRTPSPRILTLGDRIVLRTLALNAVFLTALLGTRPSLAFTALSTRGDWMLDGHHDARANALRAVLFRAAGKLEWLYLLAHDNPFKKYAKKAPELGAPSSPTASAAPSSAPPLASAIAPSPSASSSSTVARAPELPSWPVPEQLSDSVTHMPSEAESSIQSVARYVSERTPSPFERLKALHDWVADRVAYDVDSYRSGHIPPQDAESTFAKRTSVCAGYANLLEALARAADLDVVVVVGDSRTMSNDLSGQGHAWNAAKLAGHWYLLDPTWDSGYVNGATFTRRYSTAYFLTPPQVFNVDHFPDDPKWQLLDRPRSRGEFVRQPALTPTFFASGLELLTPDRSQIDVHGELEIRLNNPKRAFLLASYLVRGAMGEGQPCEVSDGAAPRIECVFQVPGRYAVQLYTNDQPQGRFDYAGQLEVNSK